jgi:hypothetical protein
VVLWEFSVPETVLEMVFSEGVRRPLGRSEGSGFNGLAQLTIPGGCRQLRRLLMLPHKPLLQLTLELPNKGTGKGGCDVIVVAIDYHPALDQRAYPVFADAVSEIEYPDAELNRNSHVRCVRSLRLVTGGIAGSTAMAKQALDKILSHARCITDNHHLDACTHQTPKRRPEAVGTYFRLPALRGARLSNFRARSTLRYRELRAHVLDARPLAGRAQYFPTKLP